MALWRLYYHLVWATAERYPLITAQVEPNLYGYILGKAYSLECIMHVVGGIEDHVHLIASIPPKLSIAEFVKSIKGSSAHYLNYSLSVRDQQFAWQRDYGVFSLGSRQLDDAVAYVQNQKSHHRQHTVIHALEEMTQEDDGPASWNHGQALAGIPVITP